MGGGFSRLKSEYRQFANMCMATIARTTPAVNVIAATNGIAESARVAVNLFLHTPRRFSPAPQERGHPATSTANGSVMRSTHNVHILPAYHMTIR